MSNNNNIRITPAEAQRLRIIAENYNNANLPQYNNSFIPLLGNEYNDNQLMNIAYNIMRARKLDDIPSQDLGYININPAVYKDVVENNRKTNSDFTHNRLYEDKYYDKIWR